MAQLSIDAFKTKWAIRFADNTTGEIAEDDMREFQADIADSFGGTQDFSSLLYNATTEYNTTTNPFAEYQGRLFKSKIDNNIGNTPPSAPNISGDYENASWVEVSRSEASPIKKWAAGVYGEGLIVVLQNDLFYRLANATRPFESSDFAAELSNGDWVLVGGSGSGGGGTGIFEPVQDITALKALDTTTAADWPDKWAILVEDEGQFYRLDRDSAVTESLPSIVAPTTGTGRWIRDQDLQLEAKVDKDGGDSQLIHVPQDSDNSTGFFAGLLTLKTNTALLLKTALDRIVSVIKTKADKATGHTTGNLAELDADGNPVDSSEHSDILAGISNNFSDFTTLRTLSTVNLEAGDKVIFKNGAQLGIYQIKLGTDIESPPDIIHTNDYNSSTNAKVLERVFVTDGFVEVSDVDVSGISDGDNILLLIKRVSGNAQVSDSVIELTDRLSDQTTALTNATWTSGTVTGITGVPGQYTNDADYEYYCIGADSWVRRPIVNNKAQLVTFIAAEKTESELITEYPDAISGQLFVTTSYLYVCVGDDLFRKIKTKDRYITTTSHPNLTANLDAHDFATGFYDDTSSGSNESTVKDDRYVDTTASPEIMYEKVTSNLWIKY